MKKELGTIISGSLSEGLLMRVGALVSPDDIKTGKFVSIVSNTYTFFSLVSDLTLNVTHNDILLFPPRAQEHFLHDFLKERDIYACALLKPMLMIGKDLRPMPVKTIPPHFTTVYEATREDVSLIFGNEDDASKRYFHIGNPLDMKTPICLDLDRFTERSNGIFGKTGTGKTFLTRLILAGLIKKEKAVNLIFDMHSEYGLQARKEGSGHAFVKGLKTLFGEKVAIFSLDPASTRRRGTNPDVVVTISYQDIHVEDILSLQDELNLHSTACEAAHLIAARYKQDWLSALLSRGDSLKEFAQDLGAHPESIAALYRKLKRLERLPFLYAGNNNNVNNSIIDQLISYLDRGINVIVEFGNYTATFVYLLMANIITRRIHVAYVAKTESFLGSQRADLEPQKLMITIEEAHKFLNPCAARQTIFGTIAREMRKYYVSLLIVDQRPSGIDQEIMSQIGTRIVAQLNDEKDIQAVLTGASNSTTLRTILASLDSKKQVLLLGHAVAMPVVIETRDYNDTFYADMGNMVSTQDINTLMNELF